MGKFKKSGLFFGTYGSGQMSFENYEHENKVKQIEHEKQIQKEMSLSINDNQIKYGTNDLEKMGVKFNKGDVIFVTKDKTGQLIWLEKGNKEVGLEHIVNGNGTKPGHALDFKIAFGIEKENIPSYLNHIITNGEIVKNTKKSIGKHEGFERIYYYDGNYYLLSGIGTNGFIVSAYPIKKGGK